jgi:hypothetical protein
MTFDLGLRPKLVRSLRGLVLDPLGFPPGILSAGISRLASRVRQVVVDVGGR